jgi:hypothetical protein
VKTAPTDDPVTETIADEQIIGGVINLEKPKFAEDFEKVDVIVQHEKVSGTPIKTYSNLNNIYGANTKFQCTGRYTDSSAPENTY